MSTPQACMAAAVRASSPRRTCPYAPDLGRCAWKEVTYARLPMEVNLPGLNPGAG
jgi:hypothetical protein